MLPIAGTVVSTAYCTTGTAACCAGLLHREVEFVTVNVGRYESLERDQYPMLLYIRLFFDLALSAGLHYSTPNA